MLIDQSGSVSEFVRFLLLLIKQLFKTDCVQMYTILIFNFTNLFHSHKLLLNLCTFLVVPVCKCFINAQLSWSTEQSNLVFLNTYVVKPVFVERDLLAIC